jgi:tripartite-type tricarboxylate transporter receptor subunit TctC
MSLLVALASGNACLPQTYPNRTVQIIVSYPAGSPPDTIARIISSRMQDSFKKNRCDREEVRGGGNIGAAAVAKAASTALRPSRRSPARRRRNGPP